MAALVPTSYRIFLGGRWQLEEFYILPHYYGQAYAFQYAFTQGRVLRDEATTDLPFRAFPWKGGYSAVNFYNVLASSIPSTLKPTVTEIRYASPGWIDLSLYAGAAVSVGLIIGNLVSSASKIHALYSDIHKEASQRKLLQIEVTRNEILLAKEELQFIEESAKALANALGFENSRDLDSRTGNPLATLKILLSYYRRLNVLADFQKSGKAFFPKE